MFFNLLFAGLLAGFEIAVHYGLGSPPESLREDAQILLRQAMILRLRILAPALFGYPKSLFCNVAHRVGSVHEMNLLMFFNLLFAGLLAGFEIAVHYGLGSPPESLREDAQILLRQAMILRLRILAPALFFPTLAFGVAIAVHHPPQRRLWLDGVALCALALWIIIRAVRTIPVNSATLEWRAEDPPKDWRQLVEKAERFHVVAAWAAVAAFGCFLASALQY